MPIGGGKGHGTNIKSISEKKKTCPHPPDESKALREERRDCKGGVYHGGPNKSRQGPCGAEDGSGVIRGPAPETSHSGFTQVLITKQSLLFKVKSPPKFLEMNKTFQVLAGGPPLSGDRHDRVMRPCVQESSAKDFSIFFSPMYKTVQ